MEDETGERSSQPWIFSEHGQTPISKTLNGRDWTCCPCGIVVQYSCLTTPNTTEPAILRIACRNCSNDSERQSKAAPGTGSKTFNYCCACWLNEWQLVSEHSSAYCNRNVDLFCVSDTTNLARRFNLVIVLDSTHNHNPTQLIRNTSTSSHWTHWSQHIFLNWLCVPRWRQC